MYDELENNTLIISEDTFGDDSMTFFLAALLAIFAVLSHQRRKVSHGKARKWYVWARGAVDERSAVIKRPTRETDHDYREKTRAAMIRAKPMQIYERRLFKPICTVARIRINPSLLQSPPLQRTSGGTHMIQNIHPLILQNPPYVFSDTI